jgi:hypothetical protein
MRGVRSVVSKLAWIPFVAVLASGCIIPDMSDAGTKLRMESKMGWNAEKEAELKKQAAALEIYLDDLGFDRTARSYFAGFFTDGGF